MPRQPTIRDRLEQDAWNNYPRFARCRAAARPRRSGSHRRLRWPGLHWQDRALLILASVLVLLLIVRVESARAQSSAEASIEYWGIEVPLDGASVRSVALNTDIRVEIAGLAARVAVTQRFRNDGLGWKEAVYRCPLPDGAAVDRLRVEAGGRVLEGEIREKEEARRQYQQARQAGQLASLVEQQRPNQFETRLANIGPGEEVLVEIGFLARVDFADGAFSLRLPMTFTPRWEGAAESTAIARGAQAYDAPQPHLVASSDEHKLALDITLHTGIALASLASRYHDVDIEARPGGYRVRLADPAARSDRAFELNWAPGYSGAPQSSLLTWDGGDAVYALLMLAPPLPEALAPQPREVVFIIDTSGSMEGDALRQAQAALGQGLGFLDPHDRFNLVRFDSEAELLFAASVPAVPFYLDGAARFIEGLRANGGTNMSPALGLAMDLPMQPGLLRQIVFITDGSVGNEQDLLSQIAERLGASRLFTVSIGSAPNSGFMRKAAAIGRGSHSHIGRPEEAAERMTRLWARIENPAVQNLCVDWGMEAEYYPELIPDLYAAEPLWLYARLPLEPREVTLCGELDGRPWETVSRLSPQEGTEELATLWARGKIEALEDSRIVGVDPAEVRRQVVDLALHFGLLTHYTSLVAVDRTPVRPRAERLEAASVPGLLPAGSTAAAGFAPTATGWPAQLALSLLSLFVATGMLLFTTPSPVTRPPAAPPSP